MSIKPYATGTLYSIDAAGNRIAVGIVGSLKFSRIEDLHVLADPCFPEEAPAIAPPPKRAEFSFDIAITPGLRKLLRHSSPALKRRDSLRMQAKRKGRPGWKHLA